MRGRVALLFVVATTGAAAGPAAAVAAPSGTDRPVAGSASGTNAINLATGTFTSDATGVVSHLGLTSFHIAGTFAFTSAGVTVSGPMTATSASGGQLTGDFEGSGTLGTGTIDVVATFTPSGGTGRFTDASGSLSGTIHERILSLAGGVLSNATEFRFSGRLSY